MGQVEDVVINGRSPKVVRSNPTQPVSGKAFQALARGSAMSSRFSPLLTHTLLA